MSKSKIPLWRYAEHTKPGSTHHRAFWNALEDAMPEGLIRRIEPGGDVRGIWEAEPAEARPAQGPVLLNCPFFSQHDNASGEGFRECASSSAAMVAAFWGKTDSDDAYNLVREKYGDTTSIDAHVAALRSLGLDARFRTDGTPAILEQEIRAGRPVMVGWLHRGPVSAPTGGGHYSVVVGFDTLNWIHHDPNGEADLIGGGYVNSTNGRKIRYSRRNWERRWRPDGKGWVVLVRPI